MKDQKVIVAGWYFVEPEKRDEVVASFKDLTLRARSAAGCLDLAITADPVAPGRINLFELWRSEEDLRAWRAVAKPPKNVARMRGIKVQKHVVQSSGPPFGGPRRPTREVPVGRPPQDEATNAS
jgi:quinol monooxygenase YgiN